MFLHWWNFGFGHPVWFISSLSFSLRVQGRRESLPAVHQVVRRRFSGPLLLPPLWRRHSCQERPYDARRPSAVNGLPLERLEELYSQALASHDEHRSVSHTYSLLPFFLFTFPISYNCFSDVCKSFTCCFTSQQMSVWAVFVGIFFIHRVLLVFMLLLYCWLLAPLLHYLREQPIRGRILLFKCGLLSSMQHI